MKQLIEIVNKILEIFNTLEIDDDRIQLPQIVMVGAQSSGKSSTIESIVGHSFLPRGTGIVTRCPLILQLIHCPLDDKTKRKEMNLDEKVAYWGVFTHSNKAFIDFDEIRDEIERRTDQIAGTNKGVSKSPITLTVYSPYVVNLTLVDLPGLTKVSVGDQPEDIEQQIMSLVMEKIKNPSSIILSVSAADVDIATSESLKLAKQVDPEGKRTLAILTKLDKGDDSTANILNGDIKLNIPVKLGIIGVMNRDTSSEKSIEEQFEIERKFLNSKYPEISSQHGIPYLSKSLEKLLMNHIQECFPGLKERIYNEMKKYEEILAKCGEGELDKIRTSITIITDFVRLFQEALDGEIVNSNGEVFIGGPAIRNIFDTKLTKSFNAINAKIDHEKIIDYLLKSGGVRPNVFPPEKFFERIVLAQIGRLYEPSLNCANMVGKELEKVIKWCVDDNNQYYAEQFPNFMRHLRNVMIKFLHDQMPRTNEFIRNIVDVEMSCVNTNHSMFLTENPESDDNEGRSNQTKQSIFFVDDQEVLGVKIADNAKKIEGLINEYFELEKEKIEDTIPKSIVHTLVNYLKKNCQMKLLTVLHTPSGHDLLVENESVTKLRNIATKQLKALRAANDYIENVQI